MRAWELKLVVRWHFCRTKIEGIQRLKISCYQLKSISYAGIVWRVYFFFRYASLPNWILIKRQIELKNRSRASVYTHARDIELKFRERNWLIGLLLSAYLLGLDERTSNFIKLLIHFDPLFCRSFRARFKFPSKVFSTTANLFHSLNRSTTVHIFNTMFSSSKNKVIDAGTQYSGRK